MMLLIAMTPLALVFTGARLRKPQVHQRVGLSTSDDATFVSNGCFGIDGSRALDRSTCVPFCWRPHYWPPAQT